MSDSEEESDEVGDEVSSADIRELIETRKEELEIERDKQEIRKLELEVEERKAKRALDAQLEDRDRAREFQSEKSRREQRYGVVYFFLLLLFFGYLVWLGHTNIVYEIIRVLLYGGAGWAAGQSYGRATAGVSVPDGNGQ